MSTNHYILLIGNCAALILCDASPSVDYFSVNSTSTKDFGDKVTDEDKSKVEPKLEALKEALKGTDIEAIKKAKEEYRLRRYQR